MKNAPLALLAVALVLAAGGRARANTAIELEGCEALDRQLLGELFTLELRTLGLEQSRFELIVSCSGEQATIRVLGAVTGSAPARVSIDLSRTAPAARERLVALAASELLAQAERERREPAPPPPAPEPAPPPPAPRPAAEPRLPSLLLGASVTRAGDPATLLTGVLLGMQAPLPGPLSLGIDTRYERGQTDTSIASVDWTLLSASLALSLEVTVAPFTLTLGPVLRGGWVALDADAVSPAQGDRLTGPWLAAAGALRGSLDLARHFLIFAGPEAGCVLLPVRGTVDQGPTLVDTGGCFFGGSAGAGYRF